MGVCRGAPWPARRPGGSGGDDGGVRGLAPRSWHAGGRLAGDVAQVGAGAAGSAGGACAAGPGSPVPSGPAPEGGGCGAGVGGRAVRGHRAADRAGRQLASSRVEDAVACRRAACRREAPGVDGHARAASTDGGAARRRPGRGGSGGCSGGDRRARSGERGGDVRLAAGGCAPCRSGTGDRRGVSRAAASRAVEVPEVPAPGALDGDRLGGAPGHRPSAFLPGEHRGLPGWRRDDSLTLAHPGAATAAVRAALCAARGDVPAWPSEQGLWVLWPGPGAGIGCSVWRKRVRAGTSCGPELSWRQLGCLVGVSTGGEGSHRCEATRCPSIERRENDRVVG